MNSTIKFAISIPDSDFQELEKFREEEGVSRSKFILEALRLWKETRERNKAIKIYREGYIRLPEDESAMKGWEKAAAGSFSEGDW